MNNSFPAAMISNSVSLFKSPLLNRDSAYDFIHRFIFLHKWAIYLFILLMGFDYFRFERVNQDSFVLFPYSSVLWVTVMIVSLQSFLCLKKKSLSDDLSFTIFFFVTVLAIPTIISLLSPPELLRTVFIFSNQISNFTQYPWSRWNFFPVFTFPHIICRCYP